MNHRLLTIYLNDHLAGATLGLELTRRATRENAGNALGAFLSDVLLPEIAEDRQTLERLMAVVGVSPSRSKVAVAWVAEKAGRLKPNGKLWRYSPLSRLLELEGLAAGIEAKRALWLALASVYDEDVVLGDIDLRRLAQRAETQRAMLEAHRIEAASDALR